MIQVLDLFSGCGGLSYGFHKLKDTYKVIGAIDFDEHANSSYETNFGITPKQLDISDLSSEVLKSTFNIQSNMPLVFVGGPPCQGFSSHKKKDKRLDDRNSLVARYVELAIQCNADAIVIENVPDLFAKKHWPHYKAAKELLDSHGYNTLSTIVNMAEYGVPQERFRAVVVASKDKQFSLPPVEYNREQFSTVRDVLETLPKLAAGEKCKDDAMHITSSHRKNTIEIFKQVPVDGGSRPKGVGPKCLDKVNGFSDVYGRLFWDKPSVTITARCRTPSCGRFLHPEQDRGLTVREAALLQSFPNDFYFEGPFDDKYKQIGNAVPPKFSESLAKHMALCFKNEQTTGLVRSIDSPIGNSFSTLISFIKQGRTIDEFIFQCS
ncbi:DNA cytosine methyltransferase [Vibrio sp. Sgm 22]|uniref:DNA cytosine methyltransferase n=1 Tax=Vibrio TaxID=662 RepID=UPI00073E81DE|nr:MULTISPECIES: DNA cytosine methyltransferase [Vibrio]MCX2758206.1 DNA cytosine methyltransferase [Vibrio sp. 14G-20]MCX2775434.1 DNA cytosine methyltransferase [Vibrio sp. Sgm 22]